MSKTESLADRELVISRVLNAPRELVWAAWTDPKHIVNWWGPNAFTTTIEKMDFRVGGLWLHTMTRIDGTRYPNHSIFKEITYPTRLVYDHGDGERIWFEATVTFEKVENGTLVTIKQLFPSKASRDEVIEKSGAIEGGKQHLTKLERYIKENLMMKDFNPELDLILERIVAVPRELVWQAWTTPEKLMPWFCPLPWKTVECEIDLRLGGKFYTVMQSPEGQRFPNMGCYVELIENERLTWTNALEPGFRPAKQPEASPGHECAEFLMTATIMLAPHVNGTKYTALVKHANAEARNTHEKMGFEEGWGTCLNQLVAMIQT